MKVRVPMTPDDPPAAELVLAIDDEAATRRLAARLAAALEPGTTVWLQGGLGAGKTTLMRGVLRALGHTGPVRSPTFTLVEPYNPPNLPIYHFDLYRLSSESEWRELGFDEMFDGRAVCLLEWPEHGGDAVPAPDLAIRLERCADGPLDDPRRTLRLRAHGERGRRCLTAVAAAC
jgi:tRNA threonylcarbamoyladenosine biosynthesis protein TsaE